MIGGGGPGRTYRENENLTLSEAELRSIGEPKRSGQWLRAFCPIHRSDHQRSLSVNMETGRFSCHNCGCWGYMDWAREEFARERGLGRDAARPSEHACQRKTPWTAPAPPPPPVEPVRDDLDELAARFREQLTDDSLGAKYLARRKISLDLAREHGLGYAPAGQWPQDGKRAHRWRFGRIVVPHERPDGTLVSLYGRAVGEVAKLPEREVEDFRRRKHRHLPGNKGYFNARVLGFGSGRLHVVEGPFDALALLASGCERAFAIFAAHEWKRHWLPCDVRRLVLAFDTDAAGQGAQEKLAEEAKLLGIEVAYLDSENYGGEKDPAAAYAAGTLTIGEFPERPAGSGYDVEEHERRRARAEEKKRRQAEAEASLERARKDAELNARVEHAPDPEPEPRTPPPSVSGEARKRQLPDEEDQEVRDLIQEGMSPEMARAEVLGEDISSVDPDEDDNPTAVGDQGDRVEDPGDDQDEEKSDLRRNAERLQREWEAEDQGEPEGTS